MAGLAVNPGFWTGRRVFVTGHTGFKGSWLVTWLALLGAEVVGFSEAGPAASSRGDRAIPSSVTDLRGDVRDLDVLGAALRSAEPEVVFHLAARALVRESHDHPVETFTTNVVGTVNVLESLRTVPSARVAVMITSDKCYANPGGDHAFVETDSLGGDDPYGGSKAAAELAIAAFRASYAQELPTVISVRAGNVIGGGDWSKDRLVPDLIRAFSADRPAEIRMPGATRPWQFVMDALHGYLLAVERAWNGRVPSAINFGPPLAEIRTVGWFCDAMAEQWGDGATWKEIRAEHPHRDAPTLALDATRASESLGWSTLLLPDEIVAWTVEWYRSGADQTAAQVRRFTELARS